MDIEKVNTTMKLIASYHELEDPNATEFGCHLIGTIITDIYTAAHLCEAWIEKKSNFGDFYLNLSYDLQYKFLQYWGLTNPETDKEADEHIKKMEDPAFFFSTPPDVIFWPHNLLLYFCNNGICGNNNLQLPKPPMSGRVYGNSSNWAIYLQGLTHDEQEQVLNQIYEYYCPKLAEHS